MKRFLATLLLTLTSILNMNAEKTNYERRPITLGEGDKLAIMMVHFGTTKDEPRAKTFNAINSEVAAAFPEAKVVEAYSSRIVMRILRDRGINYYSPKEMLEKLHTDGYTHVIVQSTHIIDGVEMESLRRDVENCNSFFKDIRVSRPLLYTPDDYRQAITAMKGEIKTEADAVLLVGHGTYEPITASYAMLDYMLKIEGTPNWSIATIEGYPTFDNGVTMLEQINAKSVCLAPCMFVAGEHAAGDIAEDWNNDLKKRGYKVELQLRGLGEFPAIRSIFIDHIRFSMENVHLDIMKKKQDYAK